MPRSEAHSPPLRNARGRAALVVVAAGLVAGCGGDDAPAASGTSTTTTTAAACAAPARLVDDRCVEPGSADDGCPAGTLGRADGSCRPAGMVASDCGEGFAHDGDVGCEPILPAAACAPGEMAVPGEAACRKVLVCGAGKWGALPVDASTVFVDASFAGASDGSNAAPFQTIGQAVAAAPDGALVAVAAGTYAEDVVVQGKALRLRGVCPELVEVAGLGAAEATLRIEGAPGAEIGGFAITGGARGVYVIASPAAIVEQVWVHDNAYGGVQLDSNATAVEVRDSLLEGNHRTGILVRGGGAAISGVEIRDMLSDAQGIFGRSLSIQPDAATDAASSASVRLAWLHDNLELGVFVAGATATFESIVVRDIAPDANDAGGYGIAIQPNPVTGEKSTATVKASLVERAHHAGVYVQGSDATVEATTVRDSLPLASGLGGFGVLAVPSEVDGAAPRATLPRSVVAQNRDVGVLLGGGELTAELVVVRDTLVDATGVSGRGLSLEPHTETDEPAHGTLRGLLVAESRQVGVAVSSSEATLESVLVRDTATNDAGLFGYGLAIQASASGGVPAVVTLGACVVEGSRDVGVFVERAKVDLANTVVRQTTPDDHGAGGRGLTIQASPTTGASEPATVDHCLVEDNHELGLIVIDVGATVSATRVRRTSPASDGRYGDGLNVFHATELAEPPKVVVDGCSIEDSARAGISNFGASVAVHATTIACAAFALDGEASLGADYAFDDQGDNRCGCPPGDPAACAVVSSDLEPPEPVSGLD